MATYAIIRHVTEALLKILQNDLASIGMPAGSIVAAPPETVEQVTGQTLILYLYQVLESPFLKNVGTQAVLGGPSGPGMAQSVTLQRDPMALDLYYLLIPFSTANNFLDTYNILGKAMQSFHDNGTFSPAALGVPVDPEEVNLEYRLSLNPLSTSDLLRLWEAVHRPYRLSVAYVVRTVQIDSSLSDATQVSGQRRINAGQM
jgi:hypothetical protein